MKLAYKTSIPISIVVMVLILMVTYTSNNAQREIIDQGQQLTKKIIFEQLEKNKKEALETRKLEVELFLNDAVQIATDYLEPQKDMWLPEEFISSDDPLAQMLRGEQQEVSQEELQELKEEMNNSLQKLTKYKIIQSVYIKSFLEEKEDVFIGQKAKENYEVLQKEIFSKNDPKKKIGYVELQYSDQFIQKQFDTARDIIVKDLALKNIEQEQDIDTILLQQTIFNFAITIVLLFIILKFISILVLSPLTKLKDGLDSFFEYLQKQDKDIEPISIKSNDEFQTMGDSLNENIQVASKLHKQIQDLNINLENKVQQRTEQLAERSTKISQLLNIAAEGFLSFDSSLKVDSEYSKECEVIFNKPIAELHIAELFYPEQSEEKTMFLKAINDIFNPKIPKKRKRVFLNLLRKDFVIDDKYINVEYQHVEDQKMILILTDITDKIALEKKLTEEKQTLKMIVSAVKDLEEFKEVINEYYDFCKEIPSYLEKEDEFRENLLVFYRKIHTYKGNFAQKELLHVVKKLHTFENALSDLVKNTESTYTEFKEIVTQNDIEKWLDEDLKILESVLDETVLDKEDVLKIAYTRIDSLESKIKTLLHFPKDERNITYEEIFDDVARMKKKPLSEYLASYTKLTEQLAQRLNKYINPVEFNGLDTVFVDSSIKPFVKTLVHIFRNSVDHGIENIDQRLDHGKSEYATIQCEASEDEQSVTLKISDDGKGIDENIIKQKALEKGIFSAEELEKMSKDQILLIIFEDAFSTNEAVTELSGRGIGLGAVKYECEKLGGKVQIESEISKGTTFQFVFPKDKL